MTFYIIYDLDSGAIKEITPSIPVASDFVKAEYAEVEGLVNGTENPADYYIVRNGITPRLKKKIKNVQISTRQKRLKKLDVINSFTDSAHIKITIDKNFVKAQVTEAAKIEFDILDSTESIAGLRDFCLHFCKNNDPHQLVGTVILSISKMVSSVAEVEISNRAANLSIFAEEILPNIEVVWKNQ